VDRRFSKKTKARWKQALHAAAHRLGRKAKEKSMRALFGSISDEEEEESDEGSNKASNWEAEI
jgi:hypothetical protein